MGGGGVDYGRAAAGRTTKRGVIAAYCGCWVSCATNLVVCDRRHWLAWPSLLFLGNLLALLLPLPLLLVEVCLSELVC